jgi:hypothetical protein
MMDFDAWFEANRDELANLLRNDQEQALFEAFLAGMEYGGGRVADVVRESGFMD